MNEETFYLLTIILGITTCITAIIGIFIGMIQWSKRTTYKRIEIVSDLFEKIRSNESVRRITAMIDWNDYFLYDGKFKKQHDADDKYGINITEKQLFDFIDETLSIFDYMVYLLSLDILKENDMFPFEYNLKRIFQNIHIANYLYSLNLWCHKLNVNCSFHYLIDYGLKKLYLLNDFNDKESQNYHCYLVV